MKRSVQEIVELLVFGLIALIVGTALLWLVGWIFGLVGVLFKFFAGLVWSLLRFIVPVAVVAAVVYALVRLVQQQRDRSATVPTVEPERAEATPTVDPAPPAAAAETPPPVDRGTVGEAEATHSGSEVWAPPQPAPPRPAAPEASWADTPTDDAAGDGETGSAERPAGVGPEDPAGIGPGTDPMGDDGNREDEDRTT